MNVSLLVAVCLGGISLILRLWLFLTDPKRG
jgi:hypothetical protein